jgi:hypothetical protein
MFAARIGGTATVLADGRVLIASGGRYPERAELYDPKSGKFSRVGQVIWFDNDAIATLLPNSKVLLTGTTDSGPAAELYDPGSSKFTQISFALQPGVTEQYQGQSVLRTAPETAVLLKDGRVLLYEYQDETWPNFVHFETYDPATGVFAPGGFATPLVLWGDPTATLLPDGRVLFAGGWGGAVASVPVASAGVYDPVSGLHLIGSMSTARMYPTAILLPNGSVLLAGGTTDQESDLSSAELFRP